MTVRLFLAVVSSAFLGLIGCKSETQYSTSNNTPFPKMITGNKALLIGCTKYLNLDRAAQLKGPTNDLALMMELLAEKPYSFPKENIIVLSDENEKEFKPTRANIERAFRYVAENTNKDEYFVFFFSGHGTQVPDQEPPDEKDPEPDGFDEVLLPTDVGRWDRRTGTLKNAIIDDQLRVWLADIVKKGCIPWVIIDACHSGTVVRAGVNEVFRKIDPEDLGIPKEELKRAAGRALSSYGESRCIRHETNAFEIEEQIPDLVALYAALPSEPTPELKPPSATDSKVYGLLTYTLHKILSNACTPLSYQDLTQRIRSQYIAWGRLYPTPVAEGRYLHRLVLGAKEISDRTRIILTRRSDHLKINVGKLYGLYPGSILAVYPPQGDENLDEIQGYVKLTEDGLDLFEAQVEPHEYNGLEAKRNLPNGGYCKPVKINFGDQTLHVAVSHYIPFDSKKINSVQLDADQKLEQHVTDALRTLEKDPISLIKVVEKPQLGNWLLQIYEGQIELVPAQGFVKEKAGNVSPPVFGPVPTDEEMVIWLKERFRRIAQAENLLEFSAEHYGDADVDVQVDMLRFRNQADQKGEVVPLAKPIVLREDDIIAFELTNRSPTSVDVTVLFIDSGYGIETLFPKRSVLDNRLASGKFLRTGRSKVNVKTTGVEHIVIIATKAEGALMDFGFLEQPTIEQIKKHSSPRGENAFDSPLGKLMQYVQYREGNTRGLTTDVFQNYAFVSLSWIVAKNKGE